MATIVAYLKISPDPRDRRGPSCLMSKHLGVPGGCEHTRVSKSVHRWEWDRDLKESEVKAILKFLDGRIAVLEVDRDTLGRCGEVLKGVAVRGLR